LSEISFPNQAILTYKPLSLCGIILHVSELVRIMVSIFLSIVGDDGVCKLPSSVTEDRHSLVFVLLALGCSPSHECQRGTWAVPWSL